MKLPTAFLLVAAQVVVWTSSAAPDGVSFGGSGGGGPKKKFATTTEHKKPKQAFGGASTGKKKAAPGKSIRQPPPQEASEDEPMKVVGELTYGESIMLPSPMFEGEEITYSLPPVEGNAGESVTCRTMGPEGEGDVDLLLRDSDATDSGSGLFCSSLGFDSNEECSLRLFPGSSYLVTVDAYLESSDVELMCMTRPIEELTLGEDITVTFPMFEKIYFVYNAPEVENLECTTSLPEGAPGDIDLDMFVEEEPGGQILNSCSSAGLASDEYCNVLTYPQYTTVVSLNPYNITLLEDDLILRCEAGPVEDLPLGVSNRNLTIPGGGGGTTANFKVEVEGPSRVLCYSTVGDPNNMTDIDLALYDLNDIDTWCNSNGPDSDEECSLAVENTTTVIVQADNYFREAVDDLVLRCFAGPVIVGMESGEPEPLVLDVGEMNTYLVDIEAPANVFCQVTGLDENATSLVLGLRYDDVLVDQRDFTLWARAPVLMGVFYPESFFIQVFADSDPPQDDIALICDFETVNVTSLEAGVPLNVEIEPFESLFFEFEVAEGPSDVVCMTSVIEAKANDTDVDMSMTPVFGNFTRVISQYDGFSDNSLIWPWAFPGTTFQVLLQEWVGSTEISLLCDALPLDQLMPGESATFSSEDLTGNRYPYYTFEFQDGEYDFMGDGKVLYMDNVADKVFNCSFDAGSDLEADLQISEVMEEGTLWPYCYLFGGDDCLVFIGNTTEYVFLEVIAKNVTGPDDGMTVTCSEVSSFSTDSSDEGTPVEESEDEGPVAVQRTGVSPFDRRLMARSAVGHAPPNKASPKAVASKRAAQKKASAKTFEEHKKSIASGKTVRQADSTPKVVGDLTLGEPVSLPSPMFEGEEITYRIPPPEESVTLVCTTSGDPSGDVDLLLVYEDSGDTECISFGVDSNEECFVRPSLDEALLVTISAFIESEDVELMCSTRPIEELTLGEDIPVSFTMRERIGFSYMAEEVETLQCTTSLPEGVEGDIDLIMFSELVEGELDFLCESLSLSSDESCDTIAFPPATTFVILTPELANTTMLEEDLILRCETGVVEEIPLGIDTNITLDENVTRTATFKFDLEDQSRITCYARASEPDVDLFMVSLGNHPASSCASIQPESSEVCSVSVENASTVIISTELFSGGLIDDLTLTCYGGPIMDLVLGEEVSLELEKGEEYTFYMDLEEAPATLSCTLNGTDDFGFQFYYDDDLVDRRTPGVPEAPAELTMGIFFVDPPVALAVFATGELGGVTLLCTSEIMDVTSLELGVPASVEIDVGDTFFFEFEVGDAPSDVVCQTTVVDGDDLDVDLAMSPVVFNYTKVLSLKDFSSENSLIWPWAYSGTTFHVLVQEFNSSGEISVQCDTVPLDRLSLGEPATVSPEDFTGSRMPYYILNAPFEAESIFDGKAFYFDDVAGKVLNCSLITGSDVEVELQMSQTSEPGVFSEDCFLLGDGGCLAFIDNTTEYVFAEIIATNVTGGPDDEITLACTEATDPFGFETESPVSFDEGTLPPQSGDEAIEMGDSEDEDDVAVGRTSGTDGHIFD